MLTFFGVYSPVFHIFPSSFLRFLGPIQST